MPRKPVPHVDDDGRIVPSPTVTDSATTRARTEPFFPAVGIDVAMRAAKCGVKALLAVLVLGRLYEMRERQPGEFVPIKRRDWRDIGLGDRGNRWRVLRKLERAGIINLVRTASGEGLSVRFAEGMEPIHRGKGGVVKLTTPRCQSDNPASGCLQSPVSRVACLPVTGNREQGGLPASGSLGGYLQQNNETDHSNVRR